MIYLIFIPITLVLIYVLVKYFKGDYTIVSRKAVSMLSPNIKPSYQSNNDYTLVYHIIYKSGKEKFITKIY